GCNGIAFTSNVPLALIVTSPPFCDLVILFRLFLGMLVLYDVDVVLIGRYFELVFSQRGLHRLPFGRWLYELPVASSTARKEKLTCTQRMTPATARRRSHRSPRARARRRHARLRSARELREPDRGEATPRQCVACTTRG